VRSRCLAASRRAVAVAQAAAEARHSESGDVDDPPVGVDRAGRPRRVGRHPGPHLETTARGRVAADVRVVVARDEDERYVELRHQMSEELEREVAAGHNDVGRGHRRRVVPEDLIDLVRHRQDPHRLRCHPV
jgi:hypothetical protein